MVCPILNVYTDGVCPVWFLQKTYFHTKSTFILSLTSYGYRPVMVIVSSTAAGRPPLLFWMKVGNLAPVTVTTVSTLAPVWACASKKLAEPVFIKVSGRGCAKHKAGFAVYLHKCLKRKREDVCFILEKDVSIRFKTAYLVTILSG